MNSLILIIWLTSLPEWVDTLKPEAGFSFQYEEVQEHQNDEAGIALDGNLGIFPQWNENWAVGVELSLAETGDPRARPSGLRLKASEGNRALSLSQLYVARRFQRGILLSAGKFPIPFRSSPMIWDDDRHPEGTYEAVSFFTANKNFEFKIQAGQFGLDRAETKLSTGESFRRSWLFVEGIETHYRWPEYLEFATSFQIYHFFQPSATLLEISTERGASYETVNEQLQIQSTRFLPIEFEGEVSSRPLGIFTSIRSALIFNLRSKDKQRGFFAETQIGRPWRKNNIHAKISFYYNEPLATLAYFSERDYGYSNRKAGLFEFSYFMTDHFKLGSSYHLSNVLEENLHQQSRHEWRVGLEARL